MKYRLIYGFAGLLIGYILGALGGWFFVTLVSTNTHDKELETMMTAFFVTGPLGSVLGALVGLIRGKPG